MELSPATAEVYVRTGFDRALAVVDRVGDDLVNERPVGDGTNSIAAYWLSIMTKIWLLNMPRVGGRALTSVVIEVLQQSLGNWAGSWVFTFTYVAVWWVILDMAYRRRIFWKV